MLLGESDYFVQLNQELERVEQILIWELNFVMQIRKRGIYEIAPFFIFCVDSKDDRTL